MLTACYVDLDTKIFCKNVPTDLVVVIIIIAWGRGEVFTGFWLGGPKVRDHWKDLGVGKRITLS
jgi:hypothetical protein